MKKLLLISLIVIGVVIYCGRANAEVELPAGGLSLQNLIDTAKTLEPDEGGWRTLAIPDKTFDRTYIEFIVFIKGDVWGMGMVCHKNGESAVLECHTILNQCVIIINENKPTPIPPEEVKATIEELWQLMLANGDFSKMRRFTILIPIQPQGA